MTKRKISLEIEPRNDLQKHVAKWLKAKARDYDTGVAGVLKDLQHGGCNQATSTTSSIPTTAASS